MHHDNDAWWNHLPALFHSQYGWCEIN
jgi:hypothetical protein